MLRYRDSKLTIIALIVFFLLVAAYGYFEAQGMLYGPTITVPSGVSRVSDPLVIITGQTSHISSLTLNGGAIPVTESGQFQAPYLLSPGDNLITLQARDAYGRTTTKTVEILYTPPATSTPAATEATSTSSASSTPMAPAR